MTRDTSPQRILFVGEALVEFVRTERERDVGIPGTYRGPFPSGAPAIAADAASLAGGRASLVATVGGDPFGRSVVQRLRRDGVDVTGIRGVAGATTGTAFVAYDESGDRSFVFHVADAAPGRLRSGDLRDEPERSAWIHVSGASLALSEPLADVTLEALERVLAHGGRLSLDPNLRADAPRASSALDVVRRLCSRAAVLFPNEEEARVLADELDAAVRSGATVCVTRGTDGVSVLEGRTTHDIPGTSVDEVDPTGAGDTFAGVFIATYAAGGDAIAAAAMADAAASAHVGTLGPMERRGWPTAKARQQPATSRSEAAGGKE